MTTPEKKKNSDDVFTWLLFCFVPLENRLTSLEGQFLYLENEEKASLSLPRGYPQEASKEAMEPGVESWLTAALPLTGHERLPKQEANWSYPEPGGVPCFPLLYLLKSLLFLKTQLRHHLLQKVFLSLFGLVPLSPSPGSLSTGLLSLLLEFLSYCIVGLSSSTSLHQCLGWACVWTK